MWRGWRRLSNTNLFMKLGRDVRKETERKLMMVKLLHIKQPLNRDCKSEYGRLYHCCSSQSLVLLLLLCCGVYERLLLQWPEARLESSSSEYLHHAAQWTQEVDRGSLKRFHCGDVDDAILFLFIQFSSWNWIVYWTFLFSWFLFFILSCRFIPITASSGKCETKWDANNFNQMTFFGARGIEGRYLQLRCRSPWLPVGSIRIRNHPWMS